MKKSDATRKKIFEAALRLFRKRGFEHTTMRDVAEAAHVAVGAAYYYFPSKDSLVFAYYEKTQNAHSTLAREGMKLAQSLEGRLLVVFHTKLDAVQRDRKLLSALFRSVGDPSSHLSIFSRRTKTFRDDSISLFREALAPADLPDDLEKVLTLALWSLSMALILYFIHDRSPHQKKTRALVDRCASLLGSITPAALFAPELVPLSASVLEALLEASVTG